MTATDTRTEDWRERRWGDTSVVNTAHAGKPGIPEYYDYVVEGTGAFPDDMLRYDAAVQMTQTDLDVSHWSMLTHGPVVMDTPRLVRLQGVREPTWERWESFGWRVLTCRSNLGNITPALREVTNKNVTWRMRMGKRARVNDCEMHYFTPLYGQEAVVCTSCSHTVQVKGGE